MSNDKTWLVLRDSKLCWIEKMPEFCTEYRRLNVNCIGCKCENLEHKAIESAPEVSNREVIGVFRLGKSGYFTQPDKTKDSFSITDRVPFEVRGWRVEKKFTVDINSQELYFLVPAEEPKKDVDHYYKEAHRTETVGRLKEVKPEYKITNSEPSQEPVKDLVIEDCVFAEQMFCPCEYSRIVKKTPMFCFMCTGKKHISSYQTTASDRTFTPSGIGQNNCFEMPKPVKEETQEEMWAEMQNYYVQQSIIRRGIIEIFQDLSERFTITRK